MKTKSNKSTGKVLPPDNTEKFRNAEAAGLRHAVWCLEQILIQYSGAAGLDEEAMAILRDARIVILKLELAIL